MLTQNEVQACQRDREGVRSVLGEPQEVTVATVPGCDTLVDWMNIFRITQASPMTPGTQPNFGQFGCQSRGI